VLRSSHVACLVLAACHNGDSPLPPVSGQIAFKSTRGRAGRQFDIFVMNADGSGLVNLTDSLAYDDWPAWSPDGSKIAFQSDRYVNAGQPLDIYVMNADGSNVSQLTSGSHNDAEPAWSPDGAKIAFVSDRDGNDEIYVMNAADGSNAVRLTTDLGFDDAPAWSPDGSKINPVAGSGVSGSVLTAVIVPRSVVGSTAPQGGRPSSKTVESTATSNDTVTIQSGSITVVTNRSGGKADTTIAKTGTGASTGVGKYDNVLVTGPAGQPAYNGWQTVIRVADSLSCNPTDPADTATKCAAANDTATTRFRFRYHTGSPASPATGTVAYRIYPPQSASDYTIPYIFFLVDDRPPDTVP
jgi:Tol biopolymer transport system component